MSNTLFPISYILKLDIIVKFDNLGFKRRNFNKKRFVGVV